MAVVMRFTPKRLTADKYDEIVKRLEQAGAGAPAGRLYHVCFGDADNLRVSEIWDSTESSKRFEQTLRPILQEFEVEPSEAEVLEVHNIIEGARFGTARP